jgi:hypothetical protein
MSSTHRHLLLDFFWQVISGPPCIFIVNSFLLQALRANCTLEGEKLSRLMSLRLCCVWHMSQGRWDRAMMGDFSRVLQKEDNCPLE